MMFMTLYFNAMFFFASFLNKNMKDDEFPRAFYLNTVDFLFFKILLYVRVRNGKSKRRRYLKHPHDKYFACACATRFLPLMQNIIN